QRTRDAEIERSLERVRTAIAAMQDSSGILGLVDTIRAELANLGAVADDRFGINTIDPTTQCIVVRTGIARGSHERIIPQAEEMSPESLFGEWRRRLSPGVHWHRRLTVDEEIHSRTIEARRLGNVLPSDWERHVRARGDTDVLDLYFEQGSLAVSRTTGPYTDDEIALLRRFTDVFALGYRRHLDLTEAEARTRQADIDLSVERVRATSMAMNDTDDLPSVVGALAREMHRLGVCSATVGINFVSEPGTEIDVWNVHRRHPWPGLEVREGVLIEVDEDFCCHHFRETPTALATEETTWQVVVDAWRSGEPQVTDGTWTRAGLESWARGWLDGSDEAFNAFAAASAGSIRLLNVPFAYGAIGYNQPQRDDHIEIVQSLAGALELGYLRYFDLQAAEQRARDAQLARARQHVRSVVTAMKTADDITDVVVVLRDELRYLGVPCDQVGVNIANEEAGTIEGSWSSALGDVGVTRGGAHGQTASAARLMEIWKAGETWNRARAEADPGALGWVVDVAFDFGTLAMNRGQTNDDAAEFSDDEIAMLHSFADEVSLGYRRFRDFETLEAQNRRLSLESALQRLRAEVASMAETDDIARVMGTVFSELRGVGVPAVSANIIVIDEPARFSRQYVLIPHYWYERGLVGTPAISDVVDGIDLFRGDRPLRDEDDWIDVVEPDLRELTWDAASFAVVRKQYRKQFGFDV
ncbi:hypothetical protein HOI71_20610, partial [Candidatus Poribacteria bacterium]|nr:hypothetical protein [Candidatus Poribacteria bacterium]